MVLKIIVLCLLSNVVTLNTIYAEDINQKNLDLNTENIGQEKSNSLTDQNDIPAFTDEFKYIADDNLEATEIFIGQEISNANKVNMETNTLFEEAVLVNSMVDTVSNTNSNNLFFILLLIIFVIISVVSTKVYLSNKQKKEGLHDYNIYEQN